jgi:hypothetical protein
MREVLSVQRPQPEVLDLLTVTTNYYRHPNQTSNRKPTIGNARMLDDRRWEVRVHASNARRLFNWNPVHTP